MEAERVDDLSHACLFNPVLLLAGNWEIDAAS